MRNAIDNMPLNRNNADVSMQEGNLGQPTSPNVHDQDDAQQQGNSSSLVQSTSVSMQEITEAEVQGFISMVSNLLPQIPTMQAPEVEQLRALASHVNACQKTIMQRMTLMPLLSKVETAFGEWDKSQVTSFAVTPQPTLPSTLPSERSQSTHIYPQSQHQLGQYVVYIHLYQYQSELDQQNIRETASQISPQAQKQLKSYNMTSLLERTKRTRKPNIPYYEAFVRTPLVRQTLAKDQCAYITSNINPQKNVQARELPQFNPDFQFSCTVFCIHIEQRFDYFAEWNPTHSTSQLSLPQNRGLNVNEIEGRFAFETGCRWIQQVFNDQFNPEWNERVAFFLVNGYHPTGKAQLDVIRVSCARGMDEGAWDGKTTYYECSTPKAMGKALNNLRTLSVYLSSGKSQIRILAPEALKVNTSSLPEPKYYENAIALHNSWCNLTRRQLLPHLQERYSPCIMLGAIYQPNFANPRYGVTGIMINMMPRFANTIPESQHHDLFNWSLEEGRWIPNDGLDLPSRQIYLDIKIPSIEHQENEHMLNKKFSTQLLDPIYSQEYGSNHFWTWFKRDKPSNQISSTPMSNYSEFSMGENPYNPQVSKAPVAEQLILPKRKLGDQHTQTCYTEYVDNACIGNLEMALRYRRAQLIKGFNAPYLSYQDAGPRYSIEVRIPTIFEFLTRPVSQADLDTLRKMQLPRWTWIPREMISQFDEETSLCRNKRDMANVRMERLNKEAYDAQLQQQEQWTYQKRPQNMISPKNRKKNKYQNN